MTIDTARDGRSGRSGRFGWGDAWRGGRQWLVVIVVAMVAGVGVGGAAAESTRGPGDLDATLNACDESASSEALCDGLLASYEGPLGLSTPNSPGQAVVIQDDGKVVVAGQVKVTTSTTADEYEWLLRRYHPDGQLDTTFGDDGTVRDNGEGAAPGATVRDLAVQDDGKIVAVGSAENAPAFAFFAARYTPDGKLDPTFGTDTPFTEPGAVAVNVFTDPTNDDFGSTHKASAAHAVTLADDGDIVVAGSKWQRRDTQTGDPSEEQDVVDDPRPGDGRMVVARLESNGNLDDSFGAGGVASADFAALGYPDTVGRDLLLDADGRAVVVGQARGPYERDRLDAPERPGGAIDEPPSAFAVARFTPDGTLDPQFGVSPISDGQVHGRVTTPFDPRPQPDVATDDSLESSRFKPTNGHAVTLDDTGRIVVAGEAGDRLALARYTPDGQLDSAFGEPAAGPTVPGTVVTDGARALDLTVQADGRLLVAGHTTGESPKVAVHRYTTGGTLDDDFADNGRTTTDVDVDHGECGSLGCLDVTSQANAVTLDGLGRLVVAGEAGPEDISGKPGHALVVARYLTAEPGTITGTVSEDGSGIAISDAGVTATAPSGQLLDTGETDAGGDYTLDGLPPSDYTVTADHDDYQADSKDGVTVEAGDTTTDVDFFLAPANGAITGTITGTITDANSDAAIADADVTATDTNGQPAGTTQTDPNGAYTLDSLSPGDYTVTADHDDYQPDSQDDVTVAAGDTTTGIDLALTSDPDLDSLEVSPAQAEVAAGEQQQFSAEATYTDGSTGDVTGEADWQSADASIATVDDTGLATGEGEGVADITATLDGASDSGELTVTAAEVDSLDVAPAEAEVAAGEQQQFSAEATYTDGSTGDVTGEADWQSADAGVATVDDTGLATGEGEGVADITATLGGASDSGELTVTAAEVDSVDVSPAQAEVAVGEDRQFTAEATYTDGSTGDVTGEADWQSADAGVATVEDTGLATGEGEGVADIIATVDDRSDAGELTVTAAEVESVEVSPAEAEVAVGEDRQFTAEATYTDGSTGDVTGEADWQSADASIATVDDGGLATGEGEGLADISATLDGESDSGELTVTGADVDSVAVSPAQAEVAVGEDQQFIAEATYTDGSTGDVTGEADWQSADASIATVDDGGLATGEGEGLADISATLDGESDSGELTVTDVDDDSTGDDDISDDTQSDDDSSDDKTTGDDTAGNDTDTGSDSDSDDDGGDGSEEVDAADEPVVRLAGPNRFATAATASEAAYPDGADMVYVATGFGFADALAGGVAAAGDEAPLLLATRSQVPEATAAELDRLAPSRVVILGGTGVIDPSVETALDEHADVVDRLAGPSRFHTAAAVSEAAYPDGDAVDTIWVASGADFADALASVPAAAEAGAPLLLATGEELTAPTEAEIARLDPDRIVLVGGTAALGDAVAAQADKVADQVIRLVGPTRFATAAAIAEAAFPTGADEIFVATGLDFADALAAGPIAGAHQAPVLLAAPGQLTEPTQATVDALDPVTARLMGGLGALGEPVESALADVIQRHPPQD